jgi:hypothetical protein
MLLTRRIFRKLIFEALLLEITQKEILDKYPAMNKPEYGYAEAINMIRNKNKYLRFLDKMIGQFITDETGNFVLYQNFSYGQIIFCVLMHEKYSSQKGILPDEYLDPNRIPDYKTLIGIIDDIDARFIQKNTDAWEKLVGKDRKATEGEDASGDAELSAKEAIAQKYAAIGGDLNQDVSGGLSLIKHASIDGWDILRPYTVSGARAIGVGAWCTVYGGHWQTYTKQGITLYYVAKQKPDRPYDNSDLYSRNQSYSDPNVYNDNFSIGFNGPGPDSIILPGSAGGPSVWGNQYGVTQDTLNNVMSAGTSRKIIRYIKGHFAVRGPGGLEGSGSGMSQEDRAQQQNRGMQDIKPTRARARNKTVFKEHLETLAEPNQRMAFTMNILRSTHLSPAVLDYIYMRNVPRVKDSRMAQSGLATEGIFPYIVISLIGSAHTEVSKKVKESIAYLTLTDDLLFDPHLEESKIKRNNIIAKLKTDYEMRGLLDPPMTDQTQWDFVPKSQFRSAGGSLNLFVNMFASSVAFNPSICELLISKVTEHMEEIIYNHKLPWLIESISESLKRLTSGAYQVGTAHRVLEGMILDGKFDDVLDDRIQEIFGFYLTPESKQMSPALKELMGAMKNMLDHANSSEEVKKYILDKFLPVMEETFESAENLGKQGNIKLSDNKLELAANLLPKLHFHIGGHIKGDYELPPRAIELIHLATDALMRSRTQYNYVFRDLLPILSTIPGFDIGTSKAIAEFAKYYTELCKVLTPFRKELLDSGTVSQMNFIPDPAEEIKYFLRYMTNPEDVGETYKTMIDSIAIRPDKAAYKIFAVGLHMGKESQMDTLSKLDVIEDGYDQIKLMNWDPESVQQSPHNALLYPPFLSSLFFGKIMEDALNLIHPLIKYKPDLYRALIKDLILAMKYVDDGRVPYNVQRGNVSSIPQVNHIFNYLGTQLNLSYTNGLKGIAGYGMPHNEYVATFKAITEIPLQVYTEFDIEVNPGAYSEFGSSFQFLASGDIRMPNMLNEKGEAV